MKSIKPFYCELIRLKSTILSLHLIVIVTSINAVTAESLCVTSTNPMILVRIFSVYIAKYFFELR
jgi:hypothetical protein